MMLAKVEQCFPAEQQIEALSILDLYGQASHEREIVRVQLAMVKAAEGQVAILRKCLAAAKSDYRDVLAWAEYPEEMKKDTWRMKDQKMVSEIRARDRKQYLDWLNGSH
jgi:uncharacterized protein YbaA (DUF1428 family)